MNPSLALSFLAALLAAGCQSGAGPDPRAGERADSFAAANVDDPVLPAFSEGEGVPVVMLGGGVAGAAAFAPHARELATDYRVVRIESLRIDRVRSRQGLPQGYSINMESQAVARTLDRLGLTGPVHIVGHSFGALVALDFALDHPQRVRSLVLAEPPAFWAVPANDLRADAGMRGMVELTRRLDPSSEPTDEQLVEFESRLGRGEARPPAPTDPGWADWQAKRSALRGISAVPLHSDKPSRLRELRRPVLIVTGKKTVAFHRRINDVLAGSFPEVQRLELEGGHGAVSTDRAGFVAALRTFFARRR